MRFLFVSENEKKFPLKPLCSLLRLSVSGYYAWKKRPESSRTKRKLAMARAIEDIHKSSRGAYGSPRIYRQLKLLGHKVSKSTVERFMRDNGIRSKRARKFRVVTTDSKHRLPVSENHLAQNFAAASANSKWTADITYVPTKEGWLYLAVVLDLFSRRVVGWQMSDTMPTELVLDAVRMAFEQRRPEPGLLHHSDRGTQYAAHEYRRLLEARGVRLSMSGRGNCYDNAVTESFFGTLKSEFIHHEQFETRAEARTKIFEWIEVFYNRTRLHSSLGFMSPEQYEAKKLVA